MHKLFNVVYVKFLFGSDKLKFTLHVFYNGLVHATVKFCFFVLFQWKDIERIMRRIWREMTSALGTEDWTEK